MSLSTTCTTVAEAAYSTYTATPSGYTLTAFINGTWNIQLTADVSTVYDATYASYTGVMAQLASGTVYANAAALAAALLAVSTDPQPADATFRNGASPV